jgi:hypothetical protein
MDTALVHASVRVNHTTGQDQPLVTDSPATPDEHTLHVDQAELLEVTDHSHNVQGAATVSCYMFGSGDIRIKDCYSLIQPSPISKTSPPKSQSCLAVIMPGVMVDQSGRHSSIFT